MVPAAVPADIVVRLNRELDAVLAEPQVRQRLLALGSKRSRSMFRLSAASGAGPGALDRSGHRGEREARLSMPHLIVETTRELAGSPDFGEVCATLHGALAATGHVRPG